MNTIGIIFLFVLLLMIIALALVIDNIQVKRHEKIKQEHLKSLKND